MDEDTRTIWCGNLSEKITEDILYELFMQGGPVQKVSIPKDMNGKQRTYGFVTYKHSNSVPYALKLYEGTSLFNQSLFIKTRNSVESQGEKPTPDQSFNQNLLQLGQKMILGNFLHNMELPIYEPNRGPHGIVYPSQVDRHGYPIDRRNRREHPYRREEEHKDYRFHRNHRYNDRRGSHNHPNDRHNDHKHNHKKHYR